jgi:hypothetical protein
MPDLSRWASATHASNASQSGVIHTRWMMTVETEGFSRGSGRSTSRGIAITLVVARPPSQILESKLAAILVIENCREARYRAAC